MTDTPTTLAETILRDVPRYWQASNRSLQPATDGEWLSRADVLAALTAAMDGVDERVGQLAQSDDPKIMLYHGEYVEALRTLLAQNAALRANTVQALDEADREYSRKTNDLIERHAEQLAALRAELDKWMERCGRERAFASSHRIRAEAAEAKVKKLRVERDDALTFLDNAVSKAPEPLKALGKYLAGRLDEDEWSTAEQHLNAAAKACADHTAAEAQIAALTARVEGLTERAVQWVEEGMVIVAPEGVPQRMALDSYRKQFSGLVRAALSTTEEGHDPQA